MKEIINNLALIDLINFCKENKIDCSNTYLHKYPRKFTYALINNTTKEEKATVTFSKSSVPTHTFSPVGDKTHNKGVYCKVHNEWYTSDEIDPCDIPF